MRGPSVPSVEQPSYGISPSAARERKGSTADTDRVASVRIVSSVGKWMELETILLSEMSQTRKDKHFLSSAKSRGMCTCLCLGHEVEQGRKKKKDAEKKKINIIFFFLNVESRF